MSRKQLKVDSVAEAYLALLAERGVECLFANAGTDFAPIVEAYAKAAHGGQKAPKPLLATHENLALSMAHGYAAASGRGPAGQGESNARPPPRLPRGFQPCAPHPPRPLTP